MRLRAAFILVVALATGGPAAAQISLLGLTNSLVQFALSRISVPGSLEITAETVQEAEDGLTEIVGLRVADGRGVWLEVDGLGVSWNARRILRGELEINRLAARGVRMLRRPDPAAVAVERRGEPPPPEPFRWPRAPIATRIADLTLTGVSVAAGVIADQPIDFDATGAARDEGNEQSVRLSLARTDAVVGRIDLDYLRDFAGGSLRLNLDAAEAAGGLVAEILGLPEGSASRVRIAADGPLDDWTVTFDAESERVLAAQGRAVIDLGPPFAFDADLVVTPGEALPPNLAAVLGPESRLTARVRESADGVIAIERAEIVSPHLGLTVSGTYARDSGMIDGTMALDLRPGLAALTEGVAFEGAGFDGRVSGTLERLTAEGALRLDGLATANFDVGRGRLSARIGRDGAVIEVALDGQADGLRVDRIGPDLLGRADLAVAARIDGPALSLSRLSLTAPLLTLTASGEADTAADTAALRYTLATPDLAPVAAAYGVTAGGRLAVQGTVDGALSAPRLTGEAVAEALTLDGEGWGQVALRHDVTLGPAPAGHVALVSEGSRLGPAEIATGFRLDGQRLTLDGLVGNVLGVVAEGGVAVDLATALTEGEVTARIADLGPVTRLLGQEVAGTAEGRIVLSVREGRQDVALDLTGAGLAAGPARLGGFDFDATLTDARGNATLTGRLSAQDAKAAGFAVTTLLLDGRASDLLGRPGADLRLSAEGLSGPDLSVARLSGTVTASDLNGTVAADAVVAAEQMEAAGVTVARISLDAAGADLTGAPTGRARLAAEGVEAPGASVPRLDATLALTARGEARDAALTVSAPRTDLDSGWLGALTLDAKAADALAADPRLDARLRLAGGDLGTLRLSLAEATVAGPRQALELALDADGTATNQPLSLRLRGRADVRDLSAAVLVLSRGEARLGAEAVTLRRPATLRLGPDIAVEGLSLAMPGGGMTADLARQGGGYTGRAALDLSDVGPLARLAGLPVDGGRLEARTRLDTRPGRVGADATLALRGVTMPGKPLGGAGLGADARGRWDGRRATAAAQVTGGFGQPVVLEAGAPVVLGETGLPSLVRGGALTGALRWKGRIGDLWTLVPVADHVVDGQADADLRLSGTLAAPRIGGALSLRDGRYENLTTGTILTDLTVGSTLRPDGGFVIDATAEDGSGGAVRAQAALDRGRVAGKVEANGAILVRRDDATAAVSLDIAIDGPLAGPAITGRVGIDRAEIRLVNATPPSVADIGPVRIRGQAPPEPDPRAGEAVRLDIRVEAPRNVFVRGRGLDSEWRIDMAVGGSAAEPAVTGRIEKIRGTLNLVGYPFDLSTGVVRFTGGFPVDPTLEIALTRENQGVTGGVYVTGSASDPDVAFRSQPSLPEDEVLPRVLFGQSKQSLTGPQTLQLALGLAALLDGSGGPIDAVRATTGLDVLRVEDDGNDGAQVTVGRNVADGVFVGAKQPLGGGPAKVTVEIEVFREVIVDTEIGTEQGSSVGVQWRRNF